MKRKYIFDVGKKYLSCTPNVKVFEGRTEKKTFFRALIFCLISVFERKAYRGMPVSKRILLLEVPDQGLSILLLEKKKITNQYDA